MPKLKDSTPPASPITVVAQVRNNIVDIIRTMPTSVITKIAESEAKSGHSFMVKTIDIGNMTRADGTTIQVLDIYDATTNTFTAPK